MRSLFLSCVMACLLAGCGGSVVKTPVHPSAGTYDALEGGAHKLGWKSQKGESSADAELTVWPPGQKKMELWTYPNGNVLAFRCNPGPKDECKKFFNQLSDASNLGARVE